MTVGASHHHWWTWKRFVGSALTALVAVLGIGWKAGIFFQAGESRAVRVDSLAAQQQRAEAWRVKYTHERDSLIVFFDRRDHQIEGRLDRIERDIIFIACVSKAPYERRPGITHCY